jgi:drug/metabolite transporter (DMT)-like permease
MQEELELVKPQIEAKPDLIALIALLIALFALSFTAIFIKISVKEISAFATVFNRFWIATIVFSLSIGYNRLHRQVSNKESAPNQPYQAIDIVLLLGVGLVHLLGRVLWTWSLTKADTADATLLSNLTPLFTTLGGWLLLGQSFDSRFIIGLVIALAGAITLGLDDLVVSADNFIGDAAALISAIFYAASFLIIEKLRTKFSTAIILVCRCLFGTIFMFPVVLIFEERIFPISWVGWFAVISLALICESLGHGLVVYSLKKFSSSFVTLFLLMEPIITAVLAWRIFAEKLGFINWLALVVVLGGIYLAKTGKGAEQQ